MYSLFPNQSPICSLNILNTHNAETFKPCAGLFRQLASHTLRKMKLNVDMKEWKLIKLMITALEVTRSSYFQESFDISKNVFE